MNHYVLFELVVLNEKRSRTNHVVFVIAGFCLWFWRTDGTGGRGPALDKGFLKKERDQVSRQIQQGPRKNILKEKHDVRMRHLSGKQKLM